MSFYLKITAVGLAKLAAANVGGPVVSLTHMAVGDGNGNPTTPSESQTALVGEKYRAQLNALYANPNDATMLLAEMVIPSDVGGWGIREVGVFDATGALFAVANFPDTYKPTAVEGGTRDMIIRAAIKVSNAATVELVIDTSIVLATRQWVLATITRAYLLPGGTTGQVLAKKSNADGDTEWKSITDTFNIAIDVVKEIQTATASQQTFTLTTCTTDGVAIYIEGAREFDYTVLSSTQVQLSRTLTSGTRVLFVQNEPNEPLKLRRLVTGRAYYIGQL